jgi:hypothetical protein
MLLHQVNPIYGVTFINLSGFARVDIGSQNGSRASSGHFVGTAFQPSSSEIGYPASGLQHDDQFQG